MNNILGSLKRDLPASIVVFLVAVPLCLGIALASGAPPLAGLLAGVIGGLVVGAASGSQLGVSGPAAGLTAIVLTSVATLGSFQLFLLAVLLAGAIQFLMGLARGGIVAYFFPSAVIKGMLAGIGIFLAATQLPHAFGHVKGQLADAAVPRPEPGVLGDLVNMLAAPHLGALLIAAACFAVLLLWESPAVKWSKGLSTLPGPLLAVVAGLALAPLAGMFPPLSLAPGHFVHLPEISGGTFRQLFAGPDWKGLANAHVWGTALTVALVASIETLLSVEAVDKIDPEKRGTPKNRELMAQGLGNMMAGLVGALPVTQVIVRSSANVHSGGRTKLSAMLHGLWVLAAVLLFPALFGMIPLAALAAILVYVGFKLARPTLFAEMWRGGWTRFTPFVATVLGVVFLDLLKGVGLGMAVALFIILRNNYKVPFHLLERRVAPGGPVRIALCEEASFLNKASIQRALLELPPDSHIIIDVSRTVRLDPDIHEILAEGQVRARNNGSTVEIVGQDAHRRHRVAAWLSVKHLREAHRFMGPGTLKAAQR